MFFVLTETYSLDWYLIRMTVPMVLGRLESSIIYQENQLELNSRDYVHTDRWQHHLDFNSAKNTTNSTWFELKLNVTSDWIFQFVVANLLLCFSHTIQLRSRGIIPFAETENRLKATLNPRGVVLGDFSAKVRKLTAFFPTIENSGLHETSNDNGTRLTTFAAANSLLVS